MAAVIESQPLQPLNPGTTITEQDRSSVYSMVGKELDNILNGPASFYADGVQKDEQTLLSDLNDFMAGIQNLQGVVNDPSNILGAVVNDVKSFTQRFEERSNADQPHDDIQIKPEFSPNTQDNNILNINPNIDPRDSFPNSNPLRPENQPKYQDASFDTGSNPSNSLTTGALDASGKLAFADEGGQRVTSITVWQDGALPMSLSVEGEEPASALEVRGMPGIPSAKPVRYLSWRDGNTPPASVFDTGAPAAQFVLPGQLNSSGGPTDWAAVLAEGLGRLNPMQAAPPQAGGTPEISSTKPVRYLSRGIADKPPASVFDTSAPTVPFVPANEVFSLDRRNAFASGNDASSLAGGAGGSSSMAGSHGPTPSALLEYIQRLNQLDANKPQASPFDPSAPGASIAPSDSPSPMGGLAGRIAALAGIDPDNPDQPVPPTGGLLALLLAAQR